MIGVHVPAIARATAKSQLCWLHNMQVTQICTHCFPPTVLITPLRFSPLFTYSPTHSRKLFVSRQDALCTGFRHLAELGSPNTNAFLRNCVNRRQPTVIVVLSTFSSSIFLPSFLPTNVVWLIGWRGYVDFLISSLFFFFVRLLLESMGK